MNPSQNYSLLMKACISQLGEGYKNTAEIEILIGRNKNYFGFNLSPGKTLGSCRKYIVTNYEIKSRINCLVGSLDAWFKSRIW